MAGKSQTKWYGDKARKLMRKVGLECLHTGAELTLTESQEEVPHAIGTLQWSAAVTDAPREDAVYVSYNTPYAVRQHEDLTLRHPDPTNPISTPGRKAKYLEDPFNRLKPKIEKYTRLKVRKALRDER